MTDEPLPALPPPEDRKALRGKMGYTRLEVARRIGVHERTIIRWEAGLSEPRASSLREYAAMLEGWKMILNGDR